MALAGYDVAFIVPHDREEIINGVRVIPLSQPKSRFERMFTTTRALLKQAKAWNADIYHFHDPELIPVGLWLRLRGKQVIYDVHEDVPRQVMSKQWIPSMLRIWIAKSVEWLERYASRRFSAVITATPHIADRFRSYGAKVMAVCNYPKLEEFHVEPLGLQETRETCVCYVGSISKIRGLEEMLEALHHCGQQVELLLAGTFANASEREWAVQHPGWRKVRELGQLNRAQVADTIHKSMVGLVVLHPTINYIDALPIKLFEYMAAGLPVIASDFPKWREIVDEAECGFCIPPHDVNALVRHIEWFLSHPEEARLMGVRGRQAVLQHYNWNAEESKLIELYRELLQHAAPLHEHKPDIVERKVVGK